ncbi:MAG: replication initiator protein A, partial [Eubacterium sp.]|nr:replication initiator protein A [Eubacterium sp.]
MNGEFEYFYGEEALTFAFYRIPKVLLTHERFKGLSVNAILLYGLLLDRTSLSVKNDWIDDKNRVYIIYTIDSIMADMSCAKASAVKYLKELTEIGLVEKVRQGLGKADVIYVKNFSTILKHNNAIPSRALNFSDKEESNILSIDNTHIYDEDPDLNLTMQIIKERMDYPGLVQRYKADDKRIDEIVSLILDVLTSNAKTIRINKENKSINVVKSV